MKKIILLLLVLSSCSQAPFDPTEENKKIQSWVGRSKDELLKSMGTPEMAVEVIEGAELITYKKVVHQDEVIVMGPNSETVISKVPTGTIKYNINFSLVENVIVEASILMVPINL